MPESIVAIDAERFLSRIDAFAAIGKTERGGVDRQALSPLDREARAELIKLARARGFAVFQDEIANLFIRREGKSPHLPPLLIGSHLDSQPTGGRFDGALGTLAAFEVLEALDDAGVQTARALEVVAWTNEEGSRYAPGTMGSMAFSKGSIPQQWGTQIDAHGIALGAALADTLAAANDVAMRPLGFPIAGYFELHIEQGPSLEKENIDIGVVEGIQGTRWLEVTMNGEAGHAGTTALAYRRDAMQAAALAISRLGASIMPGDPTARFTVGRLTVKPASINAIPDQVIFTVDLRHPDAQMIDTLNAKITSVCNAAATENGCSATIRTLFDLAPAQFPADMTACIEQSVRQLGLTSKPMISGAFHDALYAGQIAPAAMIFVACKDGLSHNEAEDCKPEDCINGAQTLLMTTLAWMDQQN